MIAELIQTAGKEVCVGEAFNLTSLGADYGLTLSLSFTQQASSKLNLNIIANFLVYMVKHAEGVADEDTSGTFWGFCTKCDSSLNRLPIPPLLHAAYPR